MTDHSGASALEADEAAGGEEAYAQLLRSVGDFVVRLERAAGHVVVQLAIDACRESKQSTGSLLSPSGSPITTTGPTALSALAVARTDSIAVRAAGVCRSSMLPPSNVTCGCSCLTCRSAHWYQSRQPRPGVVTHSPGVQPSRTSGTTAHPSRQAVSSSGGNHMIA